MIKWFDADNFLPGTKVGEVLVRAIQNNIVNKPIYYLGVYDCSEWIGELGQLINDDTTVVTHWAHINEPFE